MLARLFTFACFLSLLLCALTAGLWVYSYCRTPAIGLMAFRAVPLGTAMSLIVVQFPSGGAAAHFRLMTLTGITPQEARDSLPPDSRSAIQWGQGPREHYPHTEGRGSHFGFSAARANSSIFGTPTDDWAVVFPLWLPFALFAAYPALRFTGVLRRRRATRRGICSRCNYDLRASPGRCPECGAACKAASPAGASPAAGD